jgi:predicted ATP-dependent serine protease
MSVSCDADRLVPASAIHPGRVEWLRQGWIPLGGISLLAGDPGVGKSLWTVRVASVKVVYEAERVILT